MFKEQKRLPVSDVGWFAHTFLSFSGMTYVFLHSIANGKGDWSTFNRWGVYNNPISPCSKIPLPQRALAFHEVLHAISQIFCKMLP